MSAYREKLWLLGGPGSGNFGHSGRPGEVGGSGEGGSASPEAEGARPHWHTDSLRTKLGQPDPKQANVPAPTHPPDAIAAAKALAESETPTHKVPVSDVLDALDGNARAQFEALLADGHAANKDMGRFTKALAEEMGGAVVG